MLKVISLLSLTLLTLTACSTTPENSANTSSVTTNNNPCKATTEAEIAGLFDRWNNALQTGDSKKVVANYATKSILLPTVSNKPRYSAAEKEDYFNHFLALKPAGKVTQRHIQVGCNTAFDAGLYTFHMGKTGQDVQARYSYTYAWDGKQWLITSHHSSAMPEKASSSAQASHH